MVLNEGKAQARALRPEWELTPNVEIYESLIKDST